jgi:hypothetical protein
MNGSINIEKASISLPLAVSEAFEVMAFMDVIETGPEECEYRYKIKIDILNPLHLKIDFYFMDDLKNKIIENVYGEETVRLNEEAKDDCLLELMNVLAGNFMSFYSGAGEAYEMNLPVMDDVLHKQNYSKYISCYFNAEGLNFKVVINIK